MASSGDITFASASLYTIPSQVFLDRGVDAFDLVLGEGEKTKFARFLSKVLERGSELTEQVFAASPLVSPGEKPYFRMSVRVLPKSNNYLLEVQDYTEVMSQRQEIMRQRRELAIFNEISYLRHIYTDNEQFFLVALQQLTEAVSAEGALLYVNAEDGQQLVAHCGVIKQGAIPMSLLVTSAKLTNLTRVSLDREPVDERGMIIHYLKKRGWVSQIAIPLSVRGEKVGLVLLLSKERTAFPWQKVRLAANVAANISPIVGSELLWQQKERLSALTKGVFAHFADGLFVLDRYGQVLERNDTINNLIGTNEKIALVDGVTIASCGAIDKLMKRLRQNRQAVITVVFLGDKKSTYEITASTLKSSGLSTYLCIARNVTAWVDERTVLQRQNQELAAVDRMKDEFVSLVSHELRSPLTVVYGNLSLLEKGANPTNQPLLTDMHNNLDRLNRLVKDILEVTKLEYAEVTFNLADIELNAIAQTAYAAVKNSCDEKGIGWQIDCERQKVKNDPLRLAQVVNNLVTNAVAHTEPGGEVKLILKVVADRLIIQVADNGNGMTAEQQRHMFDRFYRGTDRPGGFGLGLYIVNSLVKRMRGHIKVESRLHQGTTITVDLPAVL